METVRNGCTQCRPATMELRLFLCFPENSPSFGQFPAGSYLQSPVSAGCITWNSQEKILSAGIQSLGRTQAVRTRLTGTLNLLSKVPLLTCSAIHREIVLVLGQDCFILKGRSSPGVLSARESGNHVETIFYLVHGLS